jgi:hypothetical protein
LKDVTIALLTVINGFGNKTDERGDAIIELENLEQKRRRHYFWAGRKNQWQ